MDEEGIEMWSSEDESTDLELKDKLPTQANGGSQGSASSAFGPEKVVLGASYTLSLLQNCRKIQEDPCHERKATKPHFRAAKLSAVAKGICRKPGEVVVMCLEVESNNLTAITQHQSHDNEVKVGSQNFRGDQITLLPMEANVQSFLQEMKERDAKPDLLRLLRNSEPSGALIMAIKQTTQQLNGNQQILVPLKDHVEIVEWFDHKKSQWKHFKNGPFLAAVEAFGYCLTSSFVLFRDAVIVSTLEKKRLDTDGMSKLEKEVKELSWAVHYLSNCKTAWMFPVCAVLDLGHPGQALLQTLDDEALLKFGEHVLRDLCQGEHCHKDVRTPWGDVYSGVNNKVSIKRLEVAIKAFQTSWEFWSQSRRQVEEWSQDLDDETRDYLRAVLSGRVDFRPSRVQRYVEFLIKLFTSSRSALLLCVERVTFILTIAPWGEHAPEDYDGLRLKAFQALKEVCWAWHMLMRPSWTIAFWLKSACTALNRQRQSGCWVVGDARTYDFPKGMLGVFRGPDEGTDSHNVYEYFQWKRKGEIRRFIGKNWDVLDMFVDCYIIDHWMWRHVMMTSVMSSFRPYKCGKPLNISVIHNVPPVQVSVNDARSSAVQLWSYIVDKSKPPGEDTDNRDVTRSLDCLVRASEEGTGDSWWPGETHGCTQQKPHDVLTINAPPEVILGQDWVNRRTGSPIARVPIFGVSRPMSETSVSFLCNSICVFGPHHAEEKLDHLVCVPLAGWAYYSACCMPHGAEQRVLRKVVRDLWEELCRALKEPEVRDFFYALRKTTGGPLLPNTDPSDSDAAAGVCFKLKPAVMASAVAKRFKSVKPRINRPVSL